MTLFDEYSSMVVWQVNLGFGLFRILAWDSLLPGCVVLAPTLIELLLPNNRGAIEISSVALPIAAFFIRVGVGKRQIVSNNCGIAVRRLQFCAFCFGILLLVLLDAVMILSHVMPKGALFAARNDCIVWVILVSAYLTSMVIAMYPGRTESRRACG